MLVLKTTLVQFILFFVAPAFGQIMINEVSAAQNAGLSDEDGEFPDWIELYNSGLSAVNLQGYSLSRREDDLISWTFPSIEIGPQDHLVVFASGKDRRSYIDHWEVPAYPQLNWQYYSGVAAPPNDWNTLSFNASSWLQAPAGIGYGDGDDATIIAPTTTLYMRQEFIIPDTSLVSVALVAVDYDDAFVAYLNGIEVARYNIGVAGIDPGHLELAYEEHEAHIYTGGDPEFFFVNEALMRAAKRPGNNVFTIEIHNVNPGSDDLSAIPYFIYGSSSQSSIYPSFPAASNLHTNFTISSFPSRLSLYNPSGGLADEVVLQDVHVNHSMGRSSDADTEWCLFESPTPDTINVLSTCYKGYASPPTFSIGAGFYDGTQTVSISSNENGTIRFTSDGSIPNAGSPFYFSPLTVNQNATVKAVVYPQDNSLLPSRSTVATYFINETIRVPVISISTDPANLWDYNTGIYVFGPNADSINYPFFGANFWAGWEKECHVEYFDRDKHKGFGTDAGLKIHGNYSKSWPQKSFRILAKDDYNNKWIDYQLFPEKPYRNKYRNFNIRNAGIDYNTVHFRDAFMHRAAKGLHFETMAYEPCVLFLNGEYWGVYGIRERQDDDYIEGNFSNVKKEEIDLLRFEGDVLAGSNEGFLNMVAQLEALDLTQQVNFEYVASELIDVENVADYFITETFYCNVDWIYENASNNVKIWRTHTPESRWRYVLWDTDLGLGLMNSEALLQYNYLGTILSPTTTSVHARIIRRLLTNDPYAIYFINRYADLLNTSFHPENMRKKAYALRDDLYPEMARHFDLWDHGPISIFNTNVARSTNVDEWLANIDTMLMWTDQRPQIVRNHIQSMIASPGQPDLTLDVEPVSAGSIHLNSITPDSLPWTGRYFAGIPVTLTAEANSGYVFHHWEADYPLQSDSSELRIQEVLLDYAEIRAIFVPLHFSVEVFPNPSADLIQVNYVIEKETQLSVALYDANGRIERELISHEQFHPEGNFSLEISKQQLQLSSGVHFLVLRSADQTETVKLIFH